MYFLAASGFCLGASSHARKTPRRRAKELLLFDGWDGEIWRFVTKNRDKTLDFESDFLGGSAVSLNSDGQRR